MATTSMDYEAANGDRYEDEAPRYERDNRSASPRPLRDEGDGGRRRSASPSGNGDRVPKDDAASKGGDDDGAINPGSNLFVTGIHPRLSEAEVSRLFEKYGEVEKCQIMRDPHTKESRGFGFVKMVTSDQADAAKEGLQGEPIDGRTLSIEKARRARPRTPTPGKYFGPPKREGGGPGGPGGPGGRGGGRFGDRYDDRRRGGYGGGGYGRDDPYRYRGGGGGGGYERRYDDRAGYREDRGYDRSYRDDRNYDRGAGYERRDRDEGYSRPDRYGSSGGGGGGSGREERYRDDRRGPSYERERYERPQGGDRDAARSRDAPAAGSGYEAGASRSEGREAHGGGSNY